MNKAPLTFFMGSYTEFPVPGFGGIGQGIYSVQLHPETGTLELLHATMTRNPSYLALSKDGRFLYAVNELDESQGPKVVAYAVQDDFSLRFLNEQNVSGGYPCHLALVESQLLVACYATGNVLQFPVTASGGLGPQKAEHAHKGSSVHKERQEGPHAHQVALHPNQEDVYVCDLGLDMLKGYRLDQGTLVPNGAKDVVLSPGGGPRHMVFNETGSLAYVLNELSGNISLLESEQGVFLEKETHLAVPKGFNGMPSASAIRIHPNQRFLYAADRASGAIAIFKTKDSTLVLVGHQYTRGVELREINLSPDGKWLIACHQNSHDTVVYEIGHDGTLEERFRTLGIFSPVCAVFL
ncbi:lactonase family protein [Maribacter sp. 2307ULW6-5]|uniref:lactonase family protein n=1 Tax=Maribacter sp. 2307ULW6-5 TaxID=3386275 RepID=UPI0039BC990D